MPAYRYRAWDPRAGATVSGRIEGPNEEQAILKLRGRELFPVEIGVVDDLTGRAASRWRGGGGRVGWERRHFPRRLATLLRAGVPLVRAIELLARQTPVRRWRELLGAIGTDLQEGQRFSAALGRHAWAFGDDFLGMIGAGEHSGRLDACLERQAAVEEKRARLRARVTTALAYPAVVALVAATVLTGMMVFVVPRFEDVFVSLPGAGELPVLTRAVLGGGRWLAANLGGIAAFALLAGAGLLAGWTKPGLRAWREAGLRRVPGIGDLVVKAALARGLRTLGTLLESGLPITEAIRLAATTTSHGPIEGALGRAVVAVEGGQPLSRALRGERDFPPLLIGLIEVGEESGGLPEMLGRSADVYEDEVDRRVELLTTLLEPMMIVGLAVAVGSVVIALFLPIVNVVQALG